MFTWRIKCDVNLLIKVKQRRFTSHVTKFSRTPKSHFISDDRETARYVAKSNNCVHHVKVITALLGTHDLFVPIVRKRKPWVEVSSWGWGIWRWWIQTLRRGFQVRLRYLKVVDTNLEKRFPGEVKVFKGGGYKPWEEVSSWGWGIWRWWMQTLSRGFQLRLRYLKVMDANLE